MFQAQLGLSNSLMETYFYPHLPKEKHIEEVHRIQDSIPSKKRKRSRTPTMTTILLQDNPSWLPVGWRVEQKVRSSGRSKGATDKYYVEPTYGRRLRSKKEVEYFLGHGVMPRKRQPSHSPNLREEPKNNNVEAPTTPPIIGFSEGSSKQLNKVELSSMDEQWSMLIAKLKNRLDVKLISPLFCDH